MESKEELEEKQTQEQRMGDGKGVRETEKKSGIRKGNKTQENVNRKQFNLEEVKKKSLSGNYSEYVV